MNEPKRDGVLVLPDAVEEVSKSGIVLNTEVGKPKPFTGTVISVGVGLYDVVKEKYLTPRVKARDRIIYKNEGYEQFGDYILMREVDIYACNGEPINNYMAVIFDELHNRIVKKGGLELVRPMTWVFEEGDGNKPTTYDKNRDLKETNPQFATVIKPNKYCTLEEKDVIFCHYFEYDRSPKIELDGVECNFIDYRQVFFRNDFEMMPDIYMGERVIEEAPKTPMGIYMQSYTEVKKDCYIRLLHVPKEQKKTHEDLKAGDVVYTGDDHQYSVIINDKEYIKLTSEWIVATVEEVA